MKKAKILIGICSHLGGKARRDSIRKTWLSIPCPADEIDYKFFIGGGIVPDDETDDVVALEANDSYEYLPEKCMAFYKWAAENADFEYLFKCDDDTFLAIDRLTSIIDPEFDLVGDTSTEEPERMAPSGGAGYLLSRKLLKDIIISEIPPKGYEDLIFGQLIRDKGYPGKGDARLCMHAGRIPLLDNDMVSCHWCSPEQMDIFHQLYNKKPIAVFKAKHVHWRDDIELYEGNIMRRRGNGDIAKCINHGKGIISINWLSWEKVLLRKKTDTIYENKEFRLKYTGKPAFDKLLKPVNDLSPKVPRVAICLPSYKRFDHLVRQIYSMLDQRYKNKHVFVAVKGVSEFFYNTAILPIFRSYIDKGQLTLRYAPNKNQLSNIIDTIRDLDISDFDLFIKVDDDDFYSPDYVKECCRFHQNLPKYWSSCYSGISYHLNLRSDYPVINKYSNANMFGFSFALSKEVMQKLIECEERPVLMHPISKKWDHGAGHHSYGFNEDHFIHNLLKETGYESRHNHSPESKSDFNIIVNKVVPSMTRGNGVLSNDFKAKNGEITTNPDYWEHILEVSHPSWRATLRVFNLKGQRLDTGHIFEVLFFDGKTLLVKWEQFGVEKFVKNKLGIYIKKEI